MFAGPNGTTTLGDPAFYQLIRTNDTINPGDDLVTLPDSVTVEEFEDIVVPDPNNAGSTLTETVRVNRVVLTFPGDLAGLAGEGAFRLKVGSSAPVRVSGEPARVINVDPADGSSDVGNTAGTAFSLGALGTSSSLIINGGVRGVGSPFDFPGRDGEPGTRDIGEQQHFLGRGPDQTPGVEVRFFNFALDRPYGALPDGTELFTTINDEQMHGSARSLRSTAICSACPSWSPMTLARPWLSVTWPSTAQ